MNKKLIKFTTLLLKKINVEVSKKEIDSQLERYYYNPTVVEFSNILSVWNIKNMVVSIPIEMLEKAATPILCFIEGEDYFYIDKIENDTYKCFFYKSSKYKILTKEELQKIWTGYCLLMESNPNSGEINGEEKRNKNKIFKNTEKLIFGSFLTSVILGLILSKDFLFFYVIGLIGLGLSLFLLFKERDFFKNDSFDICKIGKKFDCYKVITSNESKLFGFSLSEISTGFFLLITVNLVISYSNNLLQSIAPIIYLSAFSIIYSVYQQLKLKTFCIMCIAISFVLGVLIFNTYYNYSFEFILPNFYQFSISFIITVFIISVLKNYLVLNEDSKRYQHRLNTFLRSPITSYGFIDNRIDNKSFENEILIENSNSDFEIILFMNPQCKRCKTILMNLSRLFFEFEDSINLRILYSGVLEDNSDTKIMFFELKKSLDILELNEKLNYLKNYIQKTSKLESIDFKVNQSLSKQSIWSNDLDLEGTPALILNGVILPSYFGIEELSELLRRINQ